VSDGLQAGAWLLALGLGLASCVQLRRGGLPTTYVRDLLHVAAGVWVLGWPFWHHWSAPVAITAGAVLLIAIGPILARRIPAAASFRNSVSDEDERWVGLVFYTLAFALFTAAGMCLDRYPAAAALWALCLGDGVGGAVGRRLGRRFFSVPGGKRKSLEGSAAVALCAAAGVALAGAYFGEPIALGRTVVLGLVASLAEALSPRATDNLFVPLAVWLSANVPNLVTGNSAA
jgi:dolichol kinase